MALMEMTTEQRKAEQKRKRFIANAWTLLEKTGQAPSPSKDYCQLVVTTEGVVWRSVCSCNSILFEIKSVLAARRPNF